MSSGGGDSYSIAWAIEKRVSVLEGVDTGIEIQPGVYDNVQTKRREMYVMMNDGTTTLVNWWWKDVVGSGWGMYPDLPMDSANPIPQPSAMKKWQII